ncbi:type II toxin-antitoxin system VapC family toxin [Rhizobium sp.]
MGSSLSGSIYIDTNILIALFEGQHPRQLALREFMNLAIEAKNATFHTSALSFSELLVKPYRIKDEKLARQYLQLARSVDWLTVHDLAPLVVETAAVLRAGTPLRLPDALHVATAMLANCDHILTFDLGITSLPQLQHPISGRPVGRPIEAVHPDDRSLRELSEALS